MQELDFQVKQTLGTIDCNFAELKEALAVQMSAYADATVTEDSITSYKKELATLRKIRTAVDDKRKEIEREYNKPVEEFKTQVKSLLEEIDKPIDLINSQLKLFEEDRIIHKRERVSKMYVEQVGEYIKFLPLESNYNPKWDNKSYSDEDIRFDISEKVMKIKSDLAVIEGLNSEIKDDVISTYISSGNDLSKAVARNSQYLADKQKVEKQKEIEAETKVETKVETKEIEAETKLDDYKVEPTDPLGTLNQIIERTKTAKIIVSMEDLPQIKELLDFSNIKYQVIEGE